MKHILSLTLLLAASLAGAKLEAIRTLTPEQGQEVRRPVEAKVFASSLDEFPALESELLEIFQSSETTLEGKQYACRMLRHCASEASVPALAPALANPELEEFVRRVFQSLETSKADVALIEALPNGSAVGIVGTLGYRGSKSSVDAIVPFLESENSDLQFASIAALGNIGGRKALKALAGAEVKPEFSKDWKLAQLEASEGIRGYLFGLFTANSAASIAQPFLNDEDIDIRCAALIGWANAKPKKAAPVVLDALESTESRYRNTAIGLLPLLPTEPLTSVRLGMSTRSQILLIEELGRRGDVDVEDMLILAMANEDPAMRNAAIEAVGQTGDTKSIGVLIDAAPTDEAAYDALCKLNVEGTDAAILQALENSEDEKVKVTYIECLTARKATEALPAFIQLAEGEWSRTGAAAIAGMANLVSEAEFSGYADLLLASDNKKKLQALEKSIATAGQHLPDADVCALPLIAAYGKCEGEQQYAIIRALGSIGGDAAKTLLSVSMESQDPKIRDAAIRGLANWPNLDVSEQLLQLATSTEDSTHQVIALRGYIRLAYTVSDATKRVAMCEKAAAVTTRPAELKNIIGCVKVIREPAVLQFLTEQLDNPEVFTEAAWAICEISTHWKLKEAALPILERIAKTKDEKLADEAQKRIGDIKG